MRHAALKLDGERLSVFYSNAGDCPERILLATIDLAGGPGHFGQPGRYLYRYQLLRGDRVVTLWFSDPFGREAGPGNL